MLSVKLVRSLVLGEPIINPFHLHHHNHNHNHDDKNDDDVDVRKTQVEYDVDDDNDDEINKTQKMLKKKKMPLLLFIPTKELICDTFRLAAIARDIGMDFHPSSSLSHLLFSWPSSSTTTSLFSPSPPSSLSSSNNRPSVSSNTTTSTSTMSLWGCTTIPNDAVPIPFPSLSTASSISLLRYFVSLSKGLFKLVFLEIDPNSRFNYCNYDWDCSSNVALVSRVSGKQVNSMEDFSRVLAGNGWSLFRSSENKKMASALVYLFRKNESNRVRAKKMIKGGGGGECRIRELRLPALDFKSGVPLRILQYILLMTDDLFYLA
ncbi:uncharacterized protein LOC110736644 [Chenopodium quinoa]|nr:uncharacterized protein LOC110736644 [Chenopodium quinoa]